MTFSVALDDPPSSFAAPWLAEAPAGSKGLYRWRNEVREGEKDKERLKFAGRNPIAVWKLPAPAASQGKEGTRTFPPAMVIMSPPPAGYTTNSGPSPYTVPQNGFQSANPASANAYGAAAAAAAELVRKRAVASAEISRDGRWMGLVGDDGNLKLIDLESERCARRRARQQPQAAADAELRPSLQIVGPACLVLWRAHRAGFFARLALPPVCWPGRPDHRPVAARPARRRPLRGPLLVRLGPRMGSRAVRRPQGTLSLCERRRGRQAAPLGLRACWATSAEGRTSCAPSRRRRRRHRYCSASCN
jgi:hypothetical protein